MENDTVGEVTSDSRGKYDAAAADKAAGVDMDVGPSGVAGGRDGGGWGGADEGEGEKSSSDASWSSCDASGHPTHGDGADDWAGTAPYGSDDDGSSSVDAYFRFRAGGG